MRVTSPTRRRVRSTLGLAAAAAACACGSSSYGDGPAPPPPPLDTVQALPSLAFDPDTLAVSAGDTVTFVFGPVAHNVIFDSTPARSRRRTWGSRRRRR